MHLIIKFYLHISTIYLPSHPLLLQTKFLIIKEKHKCEPENSSYNLLEIYLQCKQKEWYIQFEEILCI